MIRNENEYKEAVARLIAEEKTIAAQTQELEGMGLTPEQIKRVIDPLQSFHLQLAEEVESYERLKRREIQEIRNLRGLGHALICIRIASGLNQRELAEKLGVNESQVSRDERNEYHGITLERAAKILEALGVEIRIGVNIKEPLSA
ncbi:MAG TPA: helix-turn-helix transcriptional regulator [Pirellulales bacterium]|jgi:DNA-binding XRE family transcriptional regulator|nr:helix-turn-helix transcriptional regulator [Pirellulales bacterium]